MTNGNYGYWLWDESSKLYRCSICNHFPSRIITHKGDDIFTIVSRTDAYRYCPTCGKKMKSQLLKREEEGR